MKKLNTITNTAKEGNHRKKKQALQKTVNIAKRRGHIKKR
jgi:hypothetical protein